MEIQLTEYIEFSENSGDHVTFIGQVNHYPQDGTFLEDICWEEDRYSDEENKIIACVANKMSQQFFDKYEKECEEIKLENYI